MIEEFDGSFLITSFLIERDCVYYCCTQNNTLVGNSNDPPWKYCILDVIKILINQSRLIKTGWNWSKLVQTGWNWSKVVKIVQTGQNLWWPSLFKNQQDLYLNISEPNFTSIRYFESWMTFHVLWKFDNSEYFHS